MDLSIIVPSFFTIIVRQRRISCFFDMDFAEVAPNSPRGQFLAMLNDRNAPRATGRFRSGDVGCLGFGHTDSFLSAAKEIQVASLLTLFLTHVRCSWSAIFFRRAITASVCEAKLLGTSLSRAPRCYKSWGKRRRL